MDFYQYAYIAFIYVHVSNNPVNSHRKSSFRENF